MHQLVRDVRAELGVVAVGGDELVGLPAAVGGARERARGRRVRDARRRHDACAHANKLYLRLTLINQLINQVISALLYACMAREKWIKI